MEAQETGLSEGYFMLSVPRSLKELVASFLKNIFINRLYFLEQFRFTEKLWRLISDSTCRDLGICYFILIKYMNLSRLKNKHLS